MDYPEYKKRKTEEDLRREIMELRKKVNELEENRFRSETVRDAVNSESGTDARMINEKGKVIREPEAAPAEGTVNEHTEKSSETTFPEDVQSDGNANENNDRNEANTYDEVRTGADNKVNVTGTDGEHLSDRSNEKADTDDRPGQSIHDDYDDSELDVKYKYYSDDDDDDSDDDEEDDEEEEEKNRKLSAGDLVFRILTGFLVFAICITAITAVLLATGRLNGVIDSIGNEQNESAVTESSSEVTPTVRVTLTPTPTPTPEATETPTPKPKATEAPSPTESPDSSKPSETESTVSDTAVMTFKDVDDVVTAKETTNLRNVPSQGEESFIVYILQNGETLKRTGISDEGWSRLEYEGQVVYAMTNLLTTDLTKKEDSTGTESDAADDTEIKIQTVFTDVNEQVTPKIKVNLRKLPSVTNPNATVIATVKNGEVFTRTGVNEELGWSRVEYNGQTLYCISSYVETVTPAA